MKNKQTLYWIGLMVGFFLLTGILNINSIFRIIGLVLLVVMLILIMRGQP